MHFGLNCELMEPPHEEQYSHERNHGAYVTPRPRESSVHNTVGVYKSTKCHIEIILETKVRNERLWNSEFVVFKPRVQLSFNKKI